MMCTTADRETSSDTQTSDTHHFIMSAGQGHNKQTQLSADLGLNPAPKYDSDHSQYLIIHPARKKLSTISSE